MVVFRSVENHLAFARSANTGISGFIDPFGRIVDATPIFHGARRQGDDAGLATRIRFTAGTAMCLPTAVL